MDKATRSRIQRATQSVRALLEQDYQSQLEGVYDISADRRVGGGPGAQLDRHGRLAREKLLAAVDHHAAVSSSRASAIQAFVREAAFTTLNRFVALKLLEARGLVQECIARGEQSAGFGEFAGLAPGLTQLPDHGYRLYLESIFDEISQEVGVLFDRRDPVSLIWPSRRALGELLDTINDLALQDIWSHDETLGWVYQYFNTSEERELMRDVKRGGSAAPRNSHELAVRNQFFTPRYVVQFLVDNTLGRLWLEMYGESSRLGERCEYLVRTPEQPTAQRPRKDPRDLLVLDPACGSGHFLLYSFDLLAEIYEEAWEDDTFEGASETTGRSLREDYPSLEALRRDVPALIIQHNLHGIEIDPRCAQIAALVLWLRAQRAWQDASLAAAERPRVSHTHIVVAEPIPGDESLVDELAHGLAPPLLRGLLGWIVQELRLAGELGTLLPIERGIESELERAREQFSREQRSPRSLPGLEPALRQGELNLAGIDEDSFFHEAETRIVDSLRSFAEAASGAASVRKRLFAGDATQGMALIDLLRKRFDVVLMNPPFGSGSILAKDVFERAYPRTKNDVYAAFVERGIELLQPRGFLGAITSRTGFFLSSFQKWREEVLLAEAPPAVVADLGYGVLDGAMVEVAAYCLEKGREVAA